MADIQEAIAEFGEEDVFEAPAAPLTFQERLRDTFHPSRLVPAVLAGLVTGFISMTAVLAFASLLFSGELAPFLPAGIGFIVSGMIVVAAFGALGSSIPGVIAGIQDSGIAVLAVVGVGIAASMAQDTPPNVLFMTVIAAIILSTVLTGVVYLLLGFLKAGDLIRYIPYPVIGGFLGGAGLLLVRGAITMMSGASLIEGLTQPALILHWLPGLGFAVVLIVVLRYWHHFLALPALMVGGIALFFAALAVTGTSVEEATSLGWILEGAPSGSLLHLLKPSDLQAVDWTVLLSQIGTIASVPVVMVITLLLGASGIELETRSDMDLNQELKAMGVANLLAGLGGSPPGAHYLGSSVLVHHMQASSRLTGVVTALVGLLLMLVGSSVLSYVPTPFLGGLLMYFGLSFLIKWAINSARDMSRSDYVIVLLILGVIFFRGFLAGVALGITLSVVLFVLNYSRIRVIKHELSGSTHQSTVERPRVYRDLLRQKGHWLYVLKLQGFIFFGSANTLFTQFKARISSAELQKPRYFLLDFHLVTGIDSSAMLSFQKMLQLAETERIVLIFTSIPQTMLEQLDRDEFATYRDNRWHVFSDIDAGMEWYEDRVIEDFESVGFRIKPPTMTAQLREILPDRKSVKRMDQYFDHQTVEAGTVLLNQGESAHGLYFIEDGQVRIDLILDGGRSVRLRTLHSGTVIGELGMYLQNPATATATASQKTAVAFLSEEALTEMEQKDPDIAAAFHRFMAHMIAERLARAADTMKILLD